MNIARWLAAVLLVVAGCGGGGDDDGDDDGGVEETTPILELTPRVSTACSVSSPATMIDDGLANSFRLLTFGGRHHAATTRNDQTLELAELQLDPVELRAPVWSASTWDAAYNPRMAPRAGGGIAVAWSELDVSPAIAYRVALAFLDDGGAQVGAIRYLPVTDEVYEVYLVAHPGGFVLAWNELDQLRLVMLDHDGVPAGPPAVIVPHWAHLVPHGDGLAAAWIARDDTNARTSVHAVLLDLAGNQRTAPREIFARRDVSSYGLFLTSVGADLLLAWEEHEYPEMLGDESGTAIVRVARLGSDGTPVEPVRRLQAPETGFVNVNPTVLPLPGTIALSWSRGDYIAICGGCITDNTSIPSISRR
jgi:hypothetical protein